MRLRLVIALLILIVSPLSLRVFAEPNFDVLFELDETVPPANIAVTPEGRTFLSTHQAYGANYKLLEITQDGEFAPYPNKAFSESMFSVLGTVADKEGVLWFLDTRWDYHSGRVIGWDTKTETLFKMFHITKPYIGENYILNDLAVDRTHNAIYISDTADAKTSALIVIDIDTGYIRRVLSGSTYTIPEDKNIVIDGKVLPMGEENARIGVNPITIDHNDEWVYFAPMTSESLYRVKTEDLLNDTLNDARLASKVEFFARKPFSDGITIDTAGNIYVSDITKSTLGIINNKRQYQPLFKDERLAWVEGFANAGDKGILATANQLHRSKAFNKSSTSTNKFYIIRFTPKANAGFGR
ncbi:periplasmic protein [Alteromonas sp. KUL17]|uniref:L-dopachrome tautomerase-related protein n=1 Tax=Alteromonas sp. KUL17 TaxID=2480796 RepID=UPI0010379D3B|nr:L-dopachrome tautomerase-related protein [Alteromonas sp. KUL17]TAP30563.1 hypothetical protein KUL49_02215 [Alteromonas sp. KUL17]GEA01552.1 periplasmic protein [Alteromonas sp. KUL17]